MHQQLRRWCTSPVLKPPSAFYCSPSLGVWQCWVLCWWSDAMIVLWTNRKDEPDVYDSRKFLKKSSLHEVHIFRRSSSARRITGTQQNIPKVAECDVHTHAIWPLSLVRESKILILFLMIGELEATMQAGPHLTRIYLFGSKRRGFECSYLWPPPWTSKQPIYY